MRSGSWRGFDCRSDCRDFSGDDINPGADAHVSAKNARDSSNARSSWRLDVRDAFKLHDESFFTDPKFGKVDYNRHSEQGEESKNRYFAIAQYDWRL